MRKADPLDVMTQALALLQSHESFRSFVEVRVRQIGERLELMENRLKRLEDADGNGKSFERRVVDAVIDSLHGVEFDE